MKLIVYVILLLSLSMAALASSQVIRCEETEGRSPRKYVVRIDTTDKRLDESDVEITLTELMRNRSTRRHTVDLKILYAQFGSSRTSSSSSVADAGTIIVGGYNDEEVLDFDAYHLTFPISAWDVNVKSFSASSWLQDTEIGGGLTYDLECSSKLE